MKTAGELAMRNYGRADNSEFKSENVADLVTDADKQISRMFTKFAAENFSDLNYSIIDEENLRVLGENPFDTINRSEWQFVIDPIDGTLPYSMGIPTFGIIVGVLHFGKPFCGAVYAPALGELVYGDQNSAFWLKHAFSAIQEKIELKRTEITKRSLILDMDRWVRPHADINYSNDLPANFFATATHLVYMATSRARGLYVGSGPYISVKIWDIAGGWAIMKLLDIEFMDYKTGEILTELSAHKFDNGFKIKSRHIVCKPKDFAYFKSIVEEMEN